MKKIVFIVVIMFALSCQKSTKNDDTKLINCPQDFETFFHQFSNDSIFQKNYIKFPLTVSYYNNTDLIKRKIKSTDDFISFLNNKKAINIKINKFTTETFIAKKEYYYKRIGYVNGTYITYQFKKINDCWYLITIIDETI